MAREEEVFLDKIPCVLTSAKIERGKQTTQEIKRGTSSAIESAITLQLKIIGPLNKIAKPPYKC